MIVLHEARVFSYNPSSLPAALDSSAKVFKPSRLKPTFKDSVFSFVVRKGVTKAGPAKRLDLPPGAGSADSTHPAELVIPPPQPQSRDDFLRHAEREELERADSFGKKIGHIVIQGLQSLETIPRARKGAAWPVRIGACLALLLSPLAIPAHDEIPGVAFSVAEPGAPLPAPWKNLPVVPGKAMTQYSLVHDDHTTVLQADAEQSASALMREGDIDLARTPVVAWRWKAEGPIEGADNSVGSKEDAPARLVFFFDGDKTKLSLVDRAGMSLAKQAGGQDVPYATLMYIWSTTAAPGRVIANPRTDRVQMIVVSGQPGDAGKWQSLRRNIAQDFERVFHEVPGRMIAYGLLTDTDNTGRTARAWYGDIQFLVGP